jgi:redox-sensitive bicupin YhaK (pirin superfamily)
MLTVRPPASLVHGDDGRRPANWHFSFDGRGGDLRVVNEERHEPAQPRAQPPGRRSVHLWIAPAPEGLEPPVRQRSFAAAGRRRRWLPVVVPAPGCGGPDPPTDPAALTVHATLAVYATLLDPGQAVLHRFRPGFNGELFVVGGEVHVSTEDDAAEVGAGGAALIVDEREVTIRARGIGGAALLVEARPGDGVEPG